MCQREIAHSLGFGFGKCCSTSVSLIRSRWRRTNIINAPHITVISVEVYTVGTIAVVSPVLAPHAASGRICCAVVFITIRIHAGNEIYFGILQQVLNLRIGRIILHQIPHEKNFLLHGHGLACVIQRQKHHFRFGFINIGVVGDFYIIKLASANGVNGIDYLPRRNQRRKNGTHFIELGIQFRKCQKPAHRAMVEMCRHRIVGYCEASGIADTAQIFRLILLCIMLLHIRNDHFNGQSGIAHFLNLGLRKVADQVFAFFNLAFHRNTNRPARVK
ncbi:hypothetical protein DSECCO2_534400 [anaerobic digester metagenome]